MRLRLLSPALVALGVLAASAALAPAAPRKPNVIVIVGDDMGYGDVGVHGCKDIPTPHIDSLARDGVRCTSGYVSGPYCSPTRAGLLTGRYQTRFGHEFNPGAATDKNVENGLPLTETTLADRFKAAGYKTGMVGKWHLGNGPKHVPTARGFEEYFGFLGGAHPYTPAKGGHRGIFRGTTEVEEHSYLTDAFGREALAYLDKHAKEPFFLYLAFNAVHGPMHTSEKHLKLFAGIKDEKRRTYATMMAAMDDAIGQVLAKLKTAGVADDTLVVFISDNGGPEQVNASGNGPLNGGKATTWEGGIRVPFLLRWPAGLPAGKTYDQPVIQLDFLPTLLAAAGGTEPAGAKLDGVNLLPYLRGEKAGAPHAALYWRFGGQLAVRAGDWKLTKAVTGGGRAGGGGAGSRREKATVEGAKLFNLTDDVGEQTDLTAKHPEKVKELAALWQAWNAGQVDPRWGPPAAKKKKD
jgi:arylsulfatase A-like enzyme